MPGPCYSALEAQAFGKENIVGLVSGSLQILIFIGLFLYLHRSEKRINQGRRDEIANVMIPIYWWVFLGYVISSICLLFVGALVDTIEISSGKVEWFAALGSALVYGFYRFILDGVAIFLCHQSAGMKAVKSAMILAGGVGVAVVVLQFLIYRAPYWVPSESHAKGTSLSLLCVEYLALFLFYLAIIIVPESRWIRRKAVKLYAWFYVLTLPIILATNIMMFLSEDTGYCFYIVFPMIIIGLSRPAIVFKTLRTDSRYWQQASEPTEIVDENDIRTPLLELRVGLHPARVLATEMDEIAEYNVPRIHHAELTLAGRKTMKTQSGPLVLGAGGTAKVYRGMYKRSPVAIRMLFCPEFTEEGIRGFIRESCRTFRLRHPNIVHFLGICIFPPIISSVMEQCSGSLTKYLEQVPVIESETLLFFAIDCASAIAYLHQMNPQLVHQDIKSSNFLVGEFTARDWQGPDISMWLISEGLKEFSHCFRTVEQLLNSSEDDLRGIVGSLSKHQKFNTLLEKVDFLRSVPNRPTKRVLKLADFELSKEMTARPGSPSAPGVPDTPNWLAPEVILHGKVAYTPQSDCYSLGMVLWELHSHCAPFLGFNSEEIKRLVTIDRETPKIPASCSPAYAQLLRDCWAFDPTARPTARAIRESLDWMRRSVNLDRTLEAGTLQRTAVDVRLDHIWFCCCCFCACCCLQPCFVHLHPSSLSSFFP
eukprot:m.849543 g.849543  ORF g.849543 m.849543 type:complete len:708 (+) comp59574_c0_seq9:69-2192(+)